MPDPPEGAPGLVVFTRDLRLHDHPALSAALSQHEHIVPVFVLDPIVLRGANSSPRRNEYLGGALGDLDRSLRRRGSALVIRRGEWVKEVLRVASTTGADRIHLSDDVTTYGRARLDHLERAAVGLRTEVVRYPGIGIVSPGALEPAGADHYRVFTPYYRRWRTVTWRSVLPVPRRIPFPARLEMATGQGLDAGRTAALVGGATPAARRLRAWVRGGLAGFGRRDRLADPGTSRLSADLHFGCLSPLEVATSVSADDEADGFLRQLCWRDFFLQIVAARPLSAWSPGRKPIESGRVAGRRLNLWREGRTGYPIVDAAMRQLAAEGYLPNRARMIVASFLVNELRVDWRRGAEHFLHTLIDGDVAINNLNWQWVVGTDLPHSGFRAFSPLRQAQRFDPQGDYVRRYVRELRSLTHRSVHDPDPTTRRRLGYPSKIVERTRPARAPAGRQ